MTIETQTKPQETETETENFGTAKTEITYQVDQDIFLTPFRYSDKAEVHRVINIDQSISEGLHSANVTFPYPEKQAQRFIDRNSNRTRDTNGTANVWAIRESIQGPVIGLFSLDPLKHGEELCLCTWDTFQPSMMPTATTESGVMNAPVQNESTSVSAVIPDLASIEPTEPAELSDDRDGKEWLSCCSFGYWISPEFSGRGIMTKVLSYCITQIARPVFGFERVHGECWVENLASQRVMEKCRMRSARGTPVFVPKFDKVKDIAHFIFDTPVLDP